MSSLATHDLISLAGLILAEEPDPAVKVRLLRGCLQVAGADPRLAAATEQLAASRHVRLLADEQLPNGGWGRFHTCDTKNKQRVATTEYAILRALALGLDTCHPLLARACEHIADMLPELSRYADPLEKNDRVAVGVPMVLAGVLSLIDRDHPALAPVRSLWIELARRILRSGIYSEVDEIAAHRALTGATVQGTYLTLSNRYALALLSSAPALLPAGMEDSLLDWLWHKPDGVNYFGVPLTANLLKLTAGQRECWLSSMELLSRFPRWRDHCRGAREMLWTIRRADNMWDLGARCSGSAALPLSDSWRAPRARLHDWSTRVACLLAALD